MLFWNGAVLNLDFRGTKILDSINVLIGSRKSYVAIRTFAGTNPVIIGALLNAAYEADGAVKGRILFLLDEVSRLGYMGVLEQARDAGRKYGITPLLLYQSLGQLVEQWGREGKQAWYDSTSWRLFAAVQDPETARKLSDMCGEHGVMATSLGDSVNASGRVGGAYV